MRSRVFKLFQSGMQSRATPRGMDSAEGSGTARSGHVDGRGPRDRHKKLRLPSLLLLRLQNEERMRRRRRAVAPSGRVPPSCSCSTRMYAMCDYEVQCSFEPTGGPTAGVHTGLWANSGAAHVAVAARPVMPSLRRHICQAHAGPGVPSMQWMRSHCCQRQVLDPRWHPGAAKRHCDPSEMG